MIAGPANSRRQELKGPAQHKKKHGSSITSFFDNEIENAKYEPRAYWARARRDANGLNFCFVHAPPTSMPRCEFDDATMASEHVLCKIVNPPRQQREETTHVRTVATSRSGFAAVQTSARGHHFWWPRKFWHTDSPCITAVPPREAPNYCKTYCLVNQERPTIVKRIV